MSEALQRQWSLIEALHKHRFGLRMRTLLAKANGSRATLYRDLKILRKAGFQIESENRNGEAHYRLLGEKLPPVQLSSAQLNALRLARTMLTPLEGTKALLAIDNLLKRKPVAEESAPDLQASTPPKAALPSTVGAIERALTEKRRLEITYTASRGEPTVRKIEPLGLNVTDGHLYLNAIDVAKGALRTFKVARISAANVLEEKIEPHPEYDASRVFVHSAKVWDGPLVDVAVRISARGARFVHEWPLVASQEVEPEPSGSVLVRARVSGTVETMRWVLRWGKDAQVLAPSELRSAVLAELLGSIAAYTGEVVSDS